MVITSIQNVKSVLSVAFISSCHIMVAILCIPAHLCEDVVSKAPVGNG
jgi:hypothetical protein